MSGDWRSSFYKEPEIEIIENDGDSGKQNGSMVPIGKNICIVSYRNKIKFRLPTEDLVF